MPQRPRTPDQALFEKSKLLFTYWRVICVNDKGYTDANDVIEKREPLKQQFIAVLEPHEKEKLDKIIQEYPGIELSTKHRKINILEDFFQELAFTWRLDKNNVLLSGIFKGNKDKSGDFKTFWERSEEAYDKMVVDEKSKVAAAKLKAKEARKSRKPEDKREIEELEQEVAALEAQKIERKRVQQLRKAEKAQERIEKGESSKTGAGSAA